MIKRFGWITLGLLLALSMNAQAATGTAQAPDRVGRVDWGVGIASASNENADDSYFVSTSFAYGVTPYIAIGVEGGWQEADGETADVTIGYVPILADIILRIPTVHEAIVPYGILGLGGMGVYVTDEDGDDANNNGDDVDDTGFAWKLGGGIDWFINANWILNFEFAYWDADVTLPGTAFGDSTNFWTVGAAIKYLF